MGNGIRKRSSMALRRKSRRCTKCGRAMNNQRTRCKHCNKQVGIPR